MTSAAGNETYFGDSASFTAGTTGLLSGLGFRNDGGITSDGFGKFYHPLEERQKQLDEQIPQLQAEVDVLKINHLSSDKILSEAHDLYAGWPHLTREEKQRIVESIAKKIIIGKEEVAINLCYFPGSQEMTKWQRSLPQEFFPALPHPPTPFLFPSTVPRDKNGIKVGRN